MYSFAQSSHIIASSSPSGPIQATNSSNLWHLTQKSGSRHIAWMSSFIHSPSQWWHTVSWNHSPWIKVARPVQTPLHPPMRLHEAQTGESGSLTKRVVIIRSPPARVRLLSQSLPLIHRCESPPSKHPSNASQYLLCLSPSASALILAKRLSYIIGTV